MTFQERLLAAEAEVRRLDILAAELIDTLKEFKPDLTREWELEHNTERVLPESIRPEIDRPLEPWEIPVRPIRTRARRWR
ncbi:hypothetical protein [Nocardia wallacei]|uniref:hypothetical protein n=1 Tax=Nocardia wallacei TaxID=480035 RepID=UPI002458F655|nr:hypothetical protein [Nocardia wallacei]